MQIIAYYAGMFLYQFILNVGNGIVPVAVLINTTFVTRLIKVAVLTWLHGVVIKFYYFYSVRAVNRLLKFEKALIILPF